MMLADLDRWMQAHVVRSRGIDDSSAADAHDALGTGSKKAG